MGSKDGVCHGAGTDKFIKFHSKMSGLWNKVKCGYYRGPSNKVHTVYPYLGGNSARVHSIYQRETQDIPLYDKQTILLSSVREIFCDGPNCNHKAFSERFGFISPNEGKTVRLIDRILMTSVKLSLVNASALLKANAIQVSRGSICDLLRKMPVHVDKSSVVNICMDDFASRKRYSYGTVMMDLDIHRVIDTIDSRETKKVEEWLKSYPNLKIVSRDGT